MNNYSLRRLLSLALVLALFYFSQVSTCVEAQRTSPVVPKSSSQSLNKSIPQAPGVLSPYNNSALGKRTPLVLIHGLGEKVRYEDRDHDTVTHWFHWDNFLAYLDKRPDFQKKYKIYFYHYDSARSVPVISQHLQQTLTTFITQLNGRNIKIVAYSEGGLLIRNALQDPYLDAHTQSVLTIATPFHGSPLANPDWIKEQVKSEHAFSLIRMGNPLIYAITNRLYPSFREDFHWDNFDGTLPNIHQDKRSMEDPASRNTKYSLAEKKNFITYGSYFGLEVDPAFLKHELDVSTPLPREKLVFCNIFRRNMLFSLVRHTIGKLPLIAAVTQSKQEAKLSDMHKTGLIQTSCPTITTSATIKSDAQNLSASDLAVTPVSMMMFNDGISPISSTLWLGRFTQQTQGVSVSVNTVWDALKGLKGNGHARLFPGLDHRNWMDGTTRTKETAIQDLLNPKEPPRSIFDWIVYDLG